MALALLVGATPLAQAGPLDEAKAKAHLEAVAAGDLDALMRDYADDVYMDWVGGPLDGRYRGKAEIRTVWQKFIAANAGKPRTAKFSKSDAYANPKGTTVEPRAKYSAPPAGKVQSSHRGSTPANPARRRKGPVFGPATRAGRGKAENLQEPSLRDRIREDLVPERLAINSYRDMVRYLGTEDPTTSDMLKGILAVEEEHADELADLLEDFPQTE